MTTRGILVSSAVTTALIVVAFLVPAGSTRNPEDVSDSEFVETDSTISDIQLVPEPKSDPPLKAILANFEIPIRWYKRPRPSYSYLGQNAAEDYHYLKSLAEDGDAFAAHQLANMVIGCMTDQFQTQDELDSAVTNMKETFVFVYPESGQEARATNKNEAEIYALAATRQFQICMESVGDPRDAYLRWLKMAVDGGHPVAMLDYANKMDDPVAATKLMQVVWHLGDPRALYALARHLQGIYEDGTDPTVKVSAAAAMYAFVALHSLRYPPSGNTGAGGITLDYERELRDLERLLLPHERSMAIEQASELIANNKNCCYAN